MKKIFKIVLLSIFALPLFTACETDDDSNPILKDPSSFPLNVPANALNNVYDLKNAQIIELTCSQPDYGFPISTTYKVQASLDAEFIEDTEETKANYVELETAYFSAKVNLVASELNAVLLSLWEANNEDQDFPTEPMPVFLRLKAFVTGSDRGTCLSNVIELPKVLGTTEGKLELPTTLFLVGSMLDDWKTWKPMAQITGLNGQFWSMVYFNEKAEFMFGTREKEYIGAEDSRVTLIDKAESGITGADNGNITVPKVGWYFVHIKTTLDGDDFKFELSLHPSAVYLFGVTNGEIWDYDENWKFTNPVDGSGEFVSPELAASGEVRMCAVLEGVDWWRLEFTLYKGEIFYRENNNIYSGWKDDMGSDYSVQGSPSNKVYLNFTTGTGELK